MLENTSVIHWPFQKCSDDEFNKIICTNTDRQNPRRHTIKLTNSYVSYQLPFYNCSDYEIILEFMSAKNKFLEIFEENNFTKYYDNIVEGFSNENFSCNYYTEDKFNSMINKIQNDSVKSFHVNIRSLNLNCYELKAFLSCLKCFFDVILLSECGNANTSLIEKVFDDFELYIDPPKTRKGGAGILIRKGIFDHINISSEKIEMTCNCTGCLTESLFLNAKSKDCTLTVGCIYRHPNGNMSHFNDSLSSCLQKFNKKNFFVLGGDTNIDLLKSNKLQTQNYLDIMLSHNFSPNITIPTRFSNKSMTLIDHIMTRLPKSKINSTIIAGNLISDISDHLPNFSIININFLELMRDH